jgi:hypothetical protein
MISAERFAKGMTFDEYVTFVGTAENLAREGMTMGLSAPRRDYSAFLRERYLKTRLSASQAAAMAWLAAQPGGPARIMVLSEEWSSDCRRDVPYLQRLAEAGGLEMRIFTRDGRSLTKERPDPSTSPNADLMLATMNRRGDREFASIPVAVFFDAQLREVHRYIEMPAVFRKDAIMFPLRERGAAAFFAVFETPFYDVWANAAIDEILSAIYDKRMTA